MRMETFDVAPDQRRVTLLFDPSGVSGEQGEVDAYLKAHDLSPKRQYTETRGDQEYMVYFFGHCYIEDHLTQLGIIAGLPLH
jgi:hypothetical protein